MKAGNMLEGFVENVTRIEVRNDKDVGVTSNWRIGELFLGNNGINGGIKLHFSIKENFGILEFLTNSLH